MNDNVKFDENGENAFQKEEKGKKNLMSRLSDSFNLMFAKKEDRHDAFVNMLTDETSPVIQRVTAVKQAAIQKQDSLKLILIELVKGGYAAQEELRVEAANALRSIGNIYDISIKSSLLIDMIEIAFSTINQQLSDAIRNIFLTTENFPYIKFIGQTLVRRFQIADEMSAEAWQVFARALSFMFYFVIADKNAAIKAEMQDLPVNPDKQLHTAEQLSYYIRRYIGIADEARENLVGYIAADKNGAQIAEFLAYPSLTQLYHENIALLPMLQKIYDFVLSDRQELRDACIEELRTINSPLVYDFCRPLILDESPRYLDLSEKLMDLLSNAAITDVSARDTLFSMLTTPPPRCRDIFFAELQRLAERSDDANGKLISMTKGFIKRMDCPEDVIKELVIRIFPARMCEENLDFLIYMMTGKIKVPVDIAAEAVPIIVSLNSQEQPYFSKVSKILKLVFANKVPEDIKLRIISECRKAPTPENLECVKTALKDSDPKISAPALKIFFECARNEVMTSDEFSAFSCWIISSGDMPAETVSSLISFLKNYKGRNSDLRRAVFNYLASDDEKLRMSIFELYLKWFKEPQDEKEFSEISGIMCSIASDSGWKSEDIYKKAVSFIGDALVADSPMLRSSASMLFETLKRILLSGFSEEQKLAVCRTLEKIASKEELSASAKCFAMLEGLLTAPVSTQIRLEAADFLIADRGLVMRYFQFIRHSLADPGYEDKSVILNILESGLAALPKLSVQDKMAALRGGVNNNDIITRIKFDIILGAELAPVLIDILKIRFRERDIVKLALGLLKSIPAARMHIPFIFEFKSYPDDEIIRAGAMETCSKLVSPPYTQSEGAMMMDILKTASDKSQSVMMRRTALSAIETIADEGFADSLVGIMADKSEKDEIRIAAIRAFGAMSMPAPDLYAELLSDPENPWLIKETVLNVIDDTADSSLTGVLLMLLADAPGLGKRSAESVLSKSGYEDAVTVKRLNDKCDSYRNRIKVLEMNSGKAVSEKQTADAALKAVEGKRAEADREISSLNDSIARENSAIRLLEERWTAESSSIAGKIRQVAPGWPSDSRCLPDGRQLFMDLVEEYREKKDEYEYSVDEKNKNISSLEKQIEAVSLRIEEISSQHDELAAEIARLEDIVSKPMSEGMELRRKIGDAERERETLIHSLSERRASIDSDIAEKFREKSRKKEEGESLSAMYFNFIMKNTRF